MPNRIIKESICVSDSIDRMSWYEECFYHRLWVNCDDYGRMDARIKVLKSRLFPLKDGLGLKEIEAALERLVDIGCIKLYEQEGRPYLYIPSWERHQNVRAKRSRYPPPLCGGAEDLTGWQADVSGREKNGRDEIKRKSFFKLAAEMEKEGV